MFRSDGDVSHNATRTSPGSSTHLCWSCCPQRADVAKEQGYSRARRRAPVDIEAFMNPTEHQSNQ